MIEMIKEVLPNSIVVVGNSIASSQPEFLMRTTKTDIAVIGEGEKTFVEILKRISSGEDLGGLKGILYKDGKQIIRETSRSPVANLDDKGFPMWDIFDMEAYIQSAKKYNNERVYNFIADLRPFPIMTTRGCPYRCTFCSNSSFYKENQVRAHSPEHIVQLIKTLQEEFNVNYLWFWDELSFISKKQAMPLIEALIEAKLGVMFSCTIRVGFLKKGDDEFAKMMKDAGCVQANYSLESGSPEILKAMNKKIDPKWFPIQKRVLDEAGIISQTNLVLGYPQETEKTIEETFNICYESDIMPSVGILLRAPGSLMYDYALENGDIENEEEYILNIGERQNMKINMTSMPDGRLEELANYHLKRIRDKLNLNIDDDHLICGTVIKED
mgnify:CR=1 FL=1